MLRARSVLLVNGFRPEQLWRVLLQQLDVPGGWPPRALGGVRATSHAMQSGRRRRMLSVRYHLYNGWVFDLG